MDKTPRLAVRGIILIENRLLLVNAYADRPDRLWSLPGGGVEPGASLPENLAREVCEETGLRVLVGAPVLVNEFHNPANAFHQVEVVFRCEVAAGALDDAWRDPCEIVTHRRLFTQAELRDVPLLPEVMKTLPWQDDTLRYAPLETMA